MLFSKPRICKIIHNLFDFTIIFLSTILSIFNIFHHNTINIINQIENLAVLMSMPNLGISNSKSNSENLDKICMESSDNLELDYDSYEEQDKLDVINNQNDSYKIFEAQFGKSGIKCGNFFIKNKTGSNINFEDYLSKVPELSVKNKKKPVVLIYHTHTSEGYMDKDDGSFPKDFSPRTQDKSKNVTAIGEELSKTLKENGISTLHDTTFHDYPVYEGAYKRSAKTVKEYIKKNPEIIITIDVHRDSMGENKTGKIKPTFKAKNNKKAAQIMIISGCGINKSLNFPNWEKNLVFALNLQKICEQECPGLTREFLIKNSRYNQDLTKGSILIEVGSDMNTIEESKLAAKIFGKSLSNFIKKFTK